MRSNWTDAVRRVLLSEGGYVNHPQDPGGPTNFGITIADCRRYLKADATASDVRAMHVDMARVIYKTKYWDAMRGDDLPSGVDYCLFDYAVNSGTGRAPKVLQRIMAGPVSGKIDDATLRACASRDAAAIVNSICDERLRFLKSLKTWSIFGAGWTRRVGEVRTAAIAMASNAARAPAETPAPQIDAPQIDAPQTSSPQIVPLPEHSGVPTPGKGEVPESSTTKTIATKAAPVGITAWAIAAREWVGAHPIETGALAVCAIVAIAGVVWLINAARQRRQNTPMAVRVVPAA